MEKLNSEKEVVESEKKDKKENKTSEKIDKENVPSQIPAEEELDKIVDGKIASW